MKLYYSSITISHFFSSSCLSSLYHRGYDVLYDEQTDGIAEKRAHPLQVYGVAQIPFDPNEQPIPRDNTPWWRVIVDFYKGDEDE